mmetsp:Transcript_39808/g.127996  ORF Transcript_39808/g.127996 Transcript_39808/m.127996 type:complete len:229 (+) Transcript_39808:844-1530(+)
MSRWRPPPTSRRCVQSLRSEGPERRRFALRAGGLDNSERPESQSAVGRDARDTTGTPEGGGCSFPSGGSRWVRDLITLVSLSRHVHAHVCGAGGSALSRRAAGCGLKPYRCGEVVARMCVSPLILSALLLCGVAWARMAFRILARRSESAVQRLRAHGLLHEALHLSHRYLLRRVRFGSFPWIVAQRPYSAKKRSTARTTVPAKTSLRCCAWSVAPVARRSARDCFFE